MVDRIGVHCLRGISISTTRPVQSCSSIAVEPSVDLVISIPLLLVAVHLVRGVQMCSVLWTAHDK